MKRSPLYCVYIRNFILYSKYYMDIVKTDIQYDYF